MQIEDLRRLLALADYGQVTDTAAVLRISQPTLSRLLARTENELGTRLFERNADGVRPNPHGEVALAAARDIIRRYDQLRGDLAELLDPETGTVRLAFLDSIATSLVPRILHDFRQEAPRVRVALRQEPGHEILRDLASGLSELALISPRPPGPHGWLPLQRQRLVLAVPAGHRLAARRQVRLDEVANEDFVTVPRGLGFRSLIDELLQAEGVLPRISFESTDLATIEGLVGAGLGLAVLPEQLTGASGTVGIALATPGAERVVGLTWRTDRPLPPAAARFLEYLRHRPHRTAVTAPVASAERATDSGHRAICGGTRAGVSAVQSGAMSTGDHDADVVRTYLRTFATGDLDELRAVMAEDVEIYGAGQFVRGRHHVEAAMMTPGLTVVDQQIVELHSAGHRVTVAGTNTYRQDSTGRTAVQSFCKMYQVDGGKIVRFWGEADLFGLLRGLGLLPDAELTFS